MVSIAVIYPKMLEVRMKNEIENNIHLYITHLGALATSEIDRKQMMDIISKRKEYRALAEETRKIYLLMSKWNRNLAQACRFLAKRTPSKIFGDFLDRMAHELDSGEDFKEFIKREQKVVVNAFATLYQGKLYSIDVFKEIYVSIVLSLSFFAAFAIIMPFLTGISITTTLYLITIFFVIIEIGVILYLKAVAPEDPLWQTSGEVTAVDRKLYRLFMVFMVICLIVFTGLLFGQFVFGVIDLPPSFIMSISITPLIVPGLIARREEKIIESKDKNAPSFIMSLGASASARGGNILESLKYLTAHDFGALTHDIRALYKRLNTRINKRRAWEKFAIDTNSNLIYRFIDMFVEAIGLGSDPKDVAEIISDNFITMNNLRVRRAQTSSSFVGIAYGVIIGIAFSLYISYGVVESMSSLYSSLEVTSQFLGSLLYTVPEEDLSLVHGMIFFILLFHAILSSISIKIMDGGRFMSGLVHMVGMTWFAAISGYLSQKVITSLLQIS
jgi:flagellar protein FlaJ